MIYHVNLTKKENMELLIVHLTDIHIRDDADFDILSERIGSIGGAICNHINTYSNVMNTKFVKMTRLEYLLRTANTRLPIL